MPVLQIKRGTRLQINTAASASELKVGELYLITDESRLAVGTGTTTYVDTLQPADVNNFLLDGGNA